MNIKPIEPIKVPTAVKPPAVLAEASDQFDPSQPLPSARHEKFVQGMLKGLSKTEAYAEAYDVKHRPTAYTKSTNLTARPKVMERLRWLQKQTADANVMSLTERRRFLADVVRTPIGHIDHTSPLTQEWVHETFVSKDGDSITEKDKYKVPDKLGAIRLDSQLAGDLDGEDKNKEGALPQNMTLIVQTVNQFIQSGDKPLIKDADAYEV